MFEQTKFFIKDVFTQDLSDKKMFLFKASLFISIKKKDKIYVNLGLIMLEIQK